MNTETRGLSDYEYGDTTSTGSSDLSKMLIGALAGAAVGSLIAGSFTEKGIEIRNRVGEGSKNIASNLKDKVSDVKDAIADKYESAKESASDLIDKGKQKVGLSSANNDYSASTAYGSNYSTDDDSGTGSKILLGALIVSVASTLVWSFATDKGNETRRRIAKGSKKMASTVKEKVSDVASDIAEGVSDTYQTAKDGAVDLLEQQKDKLKSDAANTSYKSSTGADNW